MPLLTVVDSTLSGNSAVSGGAGLWNEGTATISSSLFESNDVSDGSGGGIYQNFSGAVNLTNGVSFMWERPMTLTLLIIGLGLIFLPVYRQRRLRARARQEGVADGD